ncbi:hypothetical protein K457DRAFT_25130 [Linnemannia elongata AG-77]|uniref:Secreted protein n=1 Tax=Linnemannia elongata AG-77 TaxID=1314771 RepID=A0A197JG71_9FUNG|nr:hypothetical protein K457DRAFT_25130 [Linnemannia elongata AG-77]
MTEFLTKNLILFVVAALTVLVVLGGDQVQAAPIPGQQVGHGDHGGDAYDSSNDVGVNSGGDSILAVLV